MKKLDLKFIFSSFFIWRIILLIFVLLAFFLPLQEKYIAGGLPNYLKMPWFWPWANFDGEHYLAIAIEGYPPLRYFFFPFYPLVIRFVTRFFGQSLISYVASGLFVSHVSFFLALIGIWKLLLLDFKKDIARLTILLLLFFPTSFYFGSFYTESLFLALTVWSFYAARKGKWLWAGILGAASTATRIVGLALIPAFLVEVWLQKRKTKNYKLFMPIVGLLLVPTGILLYMYFLNQTTGDPLAFFHSLEAIFGEQRSTSLILLPQVFYRYFFKIIPSLNFSYAPVVFSTFLELGVALLFLALSVVSFFKLRLSYAIYLALGYLIPTFSGSFSSLPRYVLVLFPGFILMATYFRKFSKILQLIIFAILVIMLFFATALFSRGYWVA